MKGLFLFFIFFKIQLLNITSKKSKIKSEEDIIELISTNILPKKEDKDYYYVAILHTTDIHGAFFPDKRILPDGQEYTVGGLEYLGKYISTMKKEWGDQFLYFDSGDQFQGSIEGELSNSQMIMDFFNAYNLKNAALGNHEFDYGLEYLKEYMNSSKFGFLSANIKNGTTGKTPILPNFNRTRILTFENGIKIGIIGLTTLEIEKSKTNNASFLHFQDFYNIVNEESKKLKEQGADAIIILGHFGTSCLYSKEKKNRRNLYEYDLRDYQSLDQDKCKKSSEGITLLEQLDYGTVDLVLGGHTHSIVHHWVNGIPIVSNEKYLPNAHIIYLPFNRNTHKLNNELIKIEGPLPICEKIFSDYNRCNLNIFTKEAQEKYGKLKKFKFHGVLIEKDEIAKNIAKKYQKIFNSYNEDILTKTNDNLEATRLNENSLGNLYTDFLRQIPGTDISIINTSSLRTPLYKGNITNATIQKFDTLNFKIIKFNAYGWEIKKIMSQVQVGKKALYPVSGLKLVISIFPKKLISIKLYDGLNEYEIKDEKLYSIASTNFLFPLKDGEKGGEDFRTVSNWFKPRNVEYINNKFGRSFTKDHFIEYLRNIDEIKENKYYDEENQRIRLINNDLFSDFENE